MSDAFLKAAQELYDRGAAPHWIKPNSKAPVKSGWTSPKRDSMETLLKEYKEGYGLGVRLGEASRLKDGGFLANIDVDIKSDDPRHREEALEAFEKFFPGLKDKAAAIETGNGLRFMVKTKAPVASGRLASSPERCIAYIPDAEINKVQIKAHHDGLITGDQLKAGYRVRVAWEIEFMSDGKQVVVPPSIHPSTKREYRWKKAVNGPDSIPYVDPEVWKKAASEYQSKKSSEKIDESIFVEVDLLTKDLSSNIVDMIVKGDGVTDRSASCFIAAKIMLRHGFSDAEVLSVLTDKGNYLGNTAYDHRNTTLRAYAAQWVRDYCLARAKHQEDPKNVFNVISDEEDLLAPPDRDSDGWKRGIQRTGKNGDGPPRPTLENVILILTNAVSPKCFIHDSLRDTKLVGTDVPWANCKKGDHFIDHHVVEIRYWLATHYRFDPPSNVVFDAVNKIAHDNSFHPFRDWLGGLPPWDGVPRIDAWLKNHFGAVGSDAYLGEVFRKWLTASVKRIYEPGTKFDWILLLQGPQGCGKSSFGSILFGEKYFADWLPALSDKDAALALQGILCAEFSELVQLRRNELETVKGFITRQVDKVRPPYGREKVEIPRQCVFIGTTNQNEFLKDDTGNRRFNPVEVSELDFGKLIEDRDQLWAEALYYYRNGMVNRLDLEGEAKAAALEIQRDKQVSSEEEFYVEELISFIKAEFTKGVEDRFNFARFKIVNLFSPFGPFGGRNTDTKSLMLAGKALRQVGAIKKTINGRKYWEFLDVKGKVVDCSFE